MCEGPIITAAPAILAAAFTSATDDIVIAFLIAMFVAVVTCLVTIRWLVRREFRRRSQAPESYGRPRPSNSVFDAPIRWLAIRCLDPQAVQAALNLHNARSCSWSDALSKPFEPRLFISPPVDGWVLVMGCDLPDPTDDVDECFKFLTALSRKLGEVQFFHRHRAVSHHGWARLSEGKVLRAYAWAGETLWNQGGPTEAERAARVRCLAYGENSNVLGLAERDVMNSNTERVIRIAAAWSLDPMSVDTSTLEERGIAGDLLHSRLR